MNKEDKLYIVMLSKLVEKLIHPTPQAPPLILIQTQREHRVRSKASQRNDKSLIKKSALRSIKRKASHTTKSKTLH